MQDILPAH